MKDISQQVFPMGKRAGYQMGRAKPMSRSRGVVNIRISQLTYLSIRYFRKALEHLLRRILILGHAHHESNKLLKSYISLASADGDEIFMHLILIIYKAQTRQRRWEFQLLQRVGQISIKMAEHGFEFLQLNGRQIRHVAGHHLVFQKGQLFRHRGFDEAKLVCEVVVRIGSEIILVDVSFLALSIEKSQGFQKCVEWGEVGV